MGVKQDFGKPHPVAVVVAATMAAAAAVTMDAVQAQMLAVEVAQDHLLYQQVEPV